MRQIARLIAEAGKAARQTASISKVLKAEIDTDIDPRLPFAGASIEKHARQGKVTIEKRSDGLYVGGSKVILYRSARQINGKSAVGHELRKELNGQLVPSASVLDFLLAHQEYIPEEWKRDNNGNTIFIFFWDTIYRRSDGSLYVRCLCWARRRMAREFCFWLGYGWGSSHPAAVLASS